MDIFNSIPYFNGYLAFGINDYNLFNGKFIGEDGSDRDYPALPIPKYNDFHITPYNEILMIERSFNSPAHLKYVDTLVNFTGSFLLGSGQYSSNPCILSSDSNFIAATYNKKLYLLSHSLIELNSIDFNQTILSVKFDSTGHLWVLLDNNMLMF